MCFIFEYKEVLDRKTNNIIYLGKSNMKVILLKVTK